VATVGCIESTTGKCKWLHIASSPLDEAIYPAELTVLACLSQNGYGTDGCSGADFGRKSAAYRYENIWPDCGRVSGAPGATQTLKLTDFRSGD
jgi:hypothetical protein